MEIFYRIENENGYGPYGVSWDWMTKEHDIEHGCPGPNSDFIINKEIKLTFVLKSFHVFGFDSFEKLLTWFDKKEIEILYNMGFSVTKYIGENFHITNYQAIFKKVSKEKEYSLSELF